MDLNTKLQNFCSFFEWLYDVEIPGPQRRRIIDRLHVGWNDEDETDSDLMTYVLELEQKISRTEVPLRGRLREEMRSWFAEEFAEPSSSERRDVLHAVHDVVESLLPGATTVPVPRQTQGSSDMPGQVSARRSISSIGPEASFAPTRGGGNAKGDPGPWFDPAPLPKPGGPKVIFDPRTGGFEIPSPVKIPEPFGTSSGSGTITAKKVDVSEIQDDGAVVITESDYFVPPFEDVPPGDDLYEIYRYGLITRHLCSNGRVDEWTFLREIEAADLPKKELMSTAYFRYPRNRTESYMSTNYGAVRQRLFAWLPMERTGGMSAKTMNFGGGENPLLTSGLALAAFSLERQLAIANARKTNPSIVGSKVAARRASSEYAKLIASYLLECQSSPGFFLRQDASKLSDPPIDASTDELAGICIGLHYYCNMLRAEGHEPAYSPELRNVLNVISAISKLLVDHGGWYLPNATDWPGHAQHFFSRQTAWVFSYPLSLWFVSMGGIAQTTSDWNETEWKRYFSEKIFDSNILGQTEHVEAMLVRDGIRLSGGAVIPVHSSLFFAIACMFVSHAFTDDDMSSWLPSLTHGTVSPLATGILGPLGSVFSGLINYGLCKRVYDKHFDIQKNFYNMHLFSLACILGIESGRMEPWLRQMIGHTFLDMLRGRSDMDAGRKNALFAIVATMAMPSLAGDPLVQEALEPLVGGSQRGVPDQFQHDLPLADTTSWFHRLMKESGPYVIWDAHHENAQVNPAAEIKKWDLPCNFNLDGHWGRPRTYSNTYQGRTISYDPKDPTSVEANSLRAELTSKRQLAKNGGRLTIAGETCDVDFLFTRMLVAKVAEESNLNVGVWEKCRLPKLKRDLKFWTLSVPGAVPSKG